MEGFTDLLTGEAHRGFVQLAKELEERFPDPAAIENGIRQKSLRKTVR